MFTLRRISEERVEMNQIIGDEYTYITKEVNYKQFKDLFQKHFGFEHYPDGHEKSSPNMKNCYAFVVNGSFSQPLHANQKNFIMTDTGKTFANISFR